MTKPKEPDTVAVLVTKCQRGDARAWDELVVRFGASVWSVARRAQLDGDDASDVFQNTWRIAVEDLPRLREPAAFPLWIMKIARHQTMRARRGYNIARRAMPHVAREDSVDLPPDQELSRIEDRRRVSAALAHVGERCKELLRVLYFEDPTPAYAEVATRLKMQIGSIGPTRARCLEKLEKELGDRELGDRKLGDDAAA